MPAHAQDRVLFLDERSDGTLAVVKTVIQTYRGVSVPVDYRLIRKGGRWLVFDVIAERISLIRNYRDQFNEILRTSSIEDLIGRMRQKSLPENTGRERR